MNIPYKELLILRLSGLGEWKNANEMHVPKYFTEGDTDCLFTYEFLDDGRHILRGYERDMVLYEIPCIGDITHGVVRWWYPNGKRYAVKIFENGKLQGEYLEWWDNGNKYVEAKCRDGFLDGRRVEWNIHGEKMTEELYKSGVLDGERLVYVDKILVKTEVWKNGKLMKNKEEQ